MTTRQDEPPVCDGREIVSAQRIDEGPWAGRWIRREKLRLGDDPHGTHHGLCWYMWRWDRTHQKWYGIPCDDQQPPTAPPDISQLRARFAQIQQGDPLDEQLAQECRTTLEVLRLCTDQSYKDLHTMFGRWLTSHSHAIHQFLESEYRELSERAHKQSLTDQEKKRLQSIAQALTEDH